MSDYQLPEGYKQTEIGVIPEDWEVVPITKATKEIFLGLTSKVEYVNIAGIPLIRASDIAGGKLSFAEARTISVRQHRALTKYRQTKKGDVLVSKSGSLGVCAIVDVDSEFSIYESIIVLQSNQLLDSKFLLWLVRDERTQIRMIGEKVGSTVGHLNLEMFRKLIIPLPSIPEQRSLSQALSDVDALIAALDKLIVKNRDLKTATMQQLLTGKKRLPGFSGKWQILKVGDLFEITAGGDLVKSEYSKLHDDVHPYPIYANSVFDGGIYGYSKFKNYEGGCITVTARGTLGVAYYRDTPFVAIGRLIVLKPKDELDSFFLSELINHRIEFANESTSIPQLTAPQISKCELFIPAVEEQRAIATVLSDMDNAISLLESRQAKTRAIKQGMMQELLTGRTRLV